MRWEQAGTAHPKLVAAGRREEIKTGYILD